MVQYLAHDKVILRYHNHLAFVSNDKTLSWTLGMGFAINYMPKRWGIFSVADPNELHYLRYLTAIQKTVIAQGTGEKTHAFEHVRDRKTNDGFIRAAYGPGLGFRESGPGTESAGQPGISPPAASMRNPRTFVPESWTSSARNNSPPRFISSSNGKTAGNMRRFTPNPARKSERSL